MNRSILGMFVITILFAATNVGAAVVNSEPVEGPPITGMVRDSTNTPLPNVQVIITQLNRTTTTDAQGRFVFSRLAPGSYSVYAMLVGYAPAKATVVVPEEGDTVRVTLTLRRSALELSAVHVTATPSGSDALNLTQSTVELSGQSLARNLGASVAQTLANQPGLAMRYNGPAANAPVIRGLTGDRVLVLHNGDRTGDLSSSAADHGVTLDPLQASRIEVVRGPASLMYGSNALGGVVNVISSDIPNTVPNHIEGSIATQGESVNGGGAVSGGVTIPAGSTIALSVRGNYRGGGDVRIGGGGNLLNSFLHQGGGSIGAGYVGDGRTMGISYEGQQLSYGLPGEVGDPELGIRIKGARQQATGRADVSFGNTRFKQLHFDATSQWYRHDEIENTGEVGTSFGLKTQTVNALVKTAFGSVTGALGLSGLFKQYDVTGDEALTPAANSNSVGAFVYQDVPLGITRLQAGLRYDTYRITSKDSDDPRFGASRSADFDNVSGSLGLVLPIMTNTTLSGNLSRAFRAPTVEELFSNGEHHAAGTFDVGDAGLKAETNTGGEIVLRVHSGKVHSHLSAYLNRINNYIAVDIVGDTVLAPDDTVPLNRYTQRDARLRGLEGDVEIEAFPNIVLGAMGDLVRGDFSDGIREPLPFMPAARLGARARFDNGRYSFGTEYRHAFEQNRVPTAVSGSDPSGVATEAYDLVDVSAGLTFITAGRVHNFTLRVDNLLDERYRDATSRIKHFAFNPGRNVSLIYRVSF